jgi:hypothetical protein
MALVPSVEQSSTTINSMRRLTARTRRMISSIVCRSLKTGITTDRSGSFKTEARLAKAGRALGSV